MASSASPAASASDEKRARILSAAERVCARHGVLAARMEEIAAEAGVSKGTLYRFFDAKDDLLVAMVIENFAAGHREIDATLPADAPPGELFELLVERLPRVLELQAPRAPLHYAVWEIVGRDPRQRARLYGYLREFFAAQEQGLRTAIRAAQQSGRVRVDADVQAFTASILALLSGFIFRATFDPDAASAERLAAAYRALLREVLFVPGGPDA